MKLSKSIMMVVLLAVLSGMAGLVAPAAQAQSSDTFEKVLKDRKIRFGYIVSPPSAIRDPATGKLSGFYVDAAREIAELMHVEPVFIETTWANFAPALQAGQFDVSIAATFATIPRAMAVSFTNPINYQSFSGVVRKDDDRFKTLEDLDRPDIKIAVVQGSAGHEFARQNLKKAQIVALTTANLLQPFLEVSAGRADAAIQDESQLHRYLPGHPEVKPLFGGKVFNTLPIAWAVRHGDQELQGFLNTAIGYMMSSGRWDQIAKKYAHTGRYKAVPHLEPFGTF